MEFAQRLWIILLSAGLGLTSLTALGDTPADPNAAWLAEHYTKYEHRIPMRDGVNLFTVVYTPKEPGQYPILLRRTPYNLKPYTVDAGRNPGFGDGLVREKFIFVCQDVRGRFASEGTFVDVRPHKPTKNGPKDTDESTDTWDTIECGSRNQHQNLDECLRP